MAKKPETKMHALLDLGQSVWLDYLGRGMTRSGELEQLIDKGLRGMTSNPTIFEKAITGTNDYADDLGKLASSSQDARGIFEALAVTDVREAADVFRPTYDATNGREGFVSIEVSPQVARDSEGSVAEARRLWDSVDRPNVLIKIPGTREGWPAIQRCLADGININITLLFSVEHYRAVAEAYLRALETRLAEGQPIDRIASVASMFVSRVDSEVDKRIQLRGGPLMALRGKAAIAGAQLAYAAFGDMTRRDRWRLLAAKGARPQRLLWASTGTKNPDYSDVMYVESLIAPDTITTVPPETLTLFEDHGVVAQTLADTDAPEAGHVMDALAAGGIDFRDVNRILEREGIDKFTRSYERVVASLGERRD